MNQHPKQVNEFMRTFKGGVKSLVPQEVAEFENTYGERKIIHLTRNGLRVKRGDSTVVMALNRRISSLMAANIKKRRLEIGMTLEQVCTAAGLSSTTPKNRMWEIENNLSKHGLRAGTVYAIAIALDTTPDKLYPTLEEVLEGACVDKVTENTLKVKL